MKKSVSRQIFRDRKKHAMKNNFTDSWIHAIIVSEETFGEEKYREKKKGEEMQRRERQRSWNFFVSSKEEDVTAGGNRIITS